jgi:hypothetical protein
LAARQMPHFNLSFFHHNEPVTAITYDDSNSEGGRGVPPLTTSN